MILYGVFFFMIGACVGSFLNVVIWRLPHRGREVEYLGKRGRMTLSWPPSHCPMCDAPILWYQNIPILSYILLRGRCAQCRAPIPIRYPLVELALAVLWCGMYLAYFVAGWQAQVFPWQHGVGIIDLRTDWPPYVLHAIFASALLAASAIDADLFIIPLAITWFLAVMGVAGAAVLGPPMVAKTYAVVPQISFDSWWLARVIAGAAVGLVLANVLLALGWLPRSFASEVHSTSDQEGKSEESRRGFAGTGETDPLPNRRESVEPHEEPLAPPPRLTHFTWAVASAVVVLLIACLLWVTVSAKAAALATLTGGILVFLIGVLPRDAGQVDLTDEVLEEISGPNVRREMLKEVLFLAIPFVCAVAAGLLPTELPRWEWLSRVPGSVMGLLVGGGVVWLIRIGGSIAFNKEAMGMGDAHLMAGVGAVIGAPLVLLAFFTAPFLGILWAIVLKIMGKPNVLPYGPWLSVASILVLLVGNELIGIWLVIMGLRR